MYRTKSLLLYLLLYVGIGDSCVQAAAWIPSASTISHYAGKANPLTWSAATQRRLGAGLAAAALLGGGYTLYNYYNPTQSPSTVRTPEEQSVALRTLPTEELTESLQKVAESFNDSAAYLQQNKDITLEKKLDILRSMSTNINTMHTIGNILYAYSVPNNYEKLIDSNEKTFFQNIRSLIPNSNIHTHPELLSNDIRQALVNLINQTTIRSAPSKNAYLLSLDPHKQPPVPGPSDPASIQSQHQTSPLTLLQNRLQELDLSDQQTLTELRTDFDLLKLNNPKARNALTSFEAKLEVFESVNKVLQKINNATLSNINSLQSEVTIIANRIDQARNAGLNKLKDILQTALDAKNNELQERERVKQELELRKQHEEEQRLADQQAAEQEERRQAQLKKDEEKRRLEELRLETERLENERHLLEERNRVLEQTKQKETQAARGQETQQAEQSAAQKQQPLHRQEAKREPEIEQHKREKKENVPETKEEKTSSAANIENITTKATKLIKGLTKIKVDDPARAREDLSTLAEEFENINYQMDAAQKEIFTQQFNKAKNEKETEIMSKEEELKHQSTTEQTTEPEQPASATLQAAYTAPTSVTPDMRPSLPQPAGILYPSTELPLPTVQPQTQQTTLPGVEVPPQCHNP